MSIKQTHDWGMCLSTDVAILVIVPESVAVLMDMDMYGCDAVSTRCSCQLAARNMYARETANACRRGGQLHLQEAVS